MEEKKIDAPTKMERIWFVRWGFRRISTHHTNSSGIRKRRGNMRMSL